MYQAQTEANYGHFVQGRVTLAPLAISQPGDHHEGDLGRLVAEGAGGAGKRGPSGGMAALGLVLERHRGDPRDCSLVKHEC